MVRGMSLKESNISRHRDNLGSKVIDLIAFLLRRVPYEDIGSGSRSKLMAPLLEGRNISQTSKGSKNGIVWCFFV